MSQDDDDETIQAPANRISPDLDRNHPYFNLSPELAESSITIDNYPSSRAHNNYDQQSLVSDLTINSGSSSSTACTNLSAHSADMFRDETCTRLVEENGPSLINLVRRIPQQSLIRAGEKAPSIEGKSYNSARDELFIADFVNKVVRAMRVRDNDGDLQDVYRAPHDTSPLVWSVCHMSDFDTLLVCSREVGPDMKYANWLVALSRNGSEWREAHRVQTGGMGWICCALSDSRVLIGNNSTYMELFRVESGPRIERVHSIHVPNNYEWFSATCGSDTFVAMSYRRDQSVRVHRLRGDRLEELSRIQLKSPGKLLWVADRLLVADYDNDKKSHAVIELEVSDTRLERRRKLIATSENINVSSWCAVNDGLAIFDYKSKNILHYSFV